VRHAISLLAACAALLATAVGGCRNESGEMPVDGHVTTPAAPAH
jgi:hypothetical protein